MKTLINLNEVQSITIIKDYEKRCDEIIKVHNENDKYIPFLPFKYGCNRYAFEFLPKYTMTYEELIKTNYYRSQLADKIKMHNGIFYYKPKIIFHMSNGEKFEKIFCFEETLKDYLNELMNKNPLKSFSFFEI